MLLLWPLLSAQKRMLLWLDSQPLDKSMHDRSNLQIEAEYIIGPLTVEGQESPGPFYGRNQRRNSAL